MIVLIILGSNKLPSIDPFHDIDPLIIGANTEAVCQLEKDEIKAFCPTNVMTECARRDNEEEWAHFYC